MPKLEITNVELMQKFKSGDQSVIEKLYLSNKKFVSRCADKLCRQYHCEYLQEDLVSVGVIAFLEKLDGFDESLNNELLTYMKPHIYGAIRREIEANLGCMRIPKRELEKLRKAKAFYNKGGKQSENNRITTVADELKITALETSLLLTQLVTAISIEDLYDIAFSEDATEELISQSIPPDKYVFRKICYEYMEEVFNEDLSFKEQEFIGGYLGVFGRKKRTLTDIAEQFIMDENGAIKAKDKALKKLTKLCMDGKLGQWKNVYEMVMDSDTLHHL